MAHVDVHNDAWRIDSDEEDAYGVLVQMGSGNLKFWWVLCPLTATVIFSRQSSKVGCSNASCEWHEIHKQAADLIETTLE